MRSDTAWVVLIATGVGGIVLGSLLGRGRVIRMLAVVAGVCLVAYVVAPQVLGNFAGFPVYFSVNLRYVAPALALGVVVLPLALDRFGRRAAYPFCLYGGALGDATRRRDLAALEKVRGAADRRHSFVRDQPGARGGRASCGYGVARAPPPCHSQGPPVTNGSRCCRTACRRHRLRGWVLTVKRINFCHWYNNAIVLPEIYRWARDIQDSRIVIVGTFLQYPLYGTDSSNFVQYIAVRGEGGTSNAVTDCATWRRALNEGDYRYVMITTSAFPFPSAKIPGEQVWTGTDPTARLLIHTPTFQAHRRGCTESTAVWIRHDAARLSFPGAVDGLGVGEPQEGQTGPPRHGSW